MASRRADLTSLRLFVAVAEELSLTQAARRENIAIAAISKRVKELEELLGANLLFRHARGVTLTPAGVFLFNQARQITRNLDRMQNAIGEYAQGITGHVRVQASTAVVSQYLPEQLRDFLTENPQVRVDLRESSSLLVIKAVVEGTADIGIRAASAGAAELGLAEARPSISGLESLPYHDDRLSVIVPMRHPLSEHSEVPFEEVVRFDMVASRDTSSLHRLLLIAANDAGLTMNVRMQLGNFYCICRMVQAGLGVAILPDLAARAHVGSMGLRAVPLEDRWAARSYQVCFRSLDLLPTVARELAEHLSSLRGALAGSG